VLCVTVDWLCCSYSCVCNWLAQRNCTVFCWYSALCGCICVSFSADVHLCEWFIKSVSCNTVAVSFKFM